MTPCLTCLVVGWLIPLITDSALPQRVSVLLRRIPASLMFDLPHLLPARWRAVQAHAGWRLQRLAFLQVAPGTCAAHNRRAPGYHEAILALPITAAHRPPLQSNRRFARAESKRQSQRDPALRGDGGRDFDSRRAQGVTADLAKRDLQARGRRASSRALHAGRSSSCSCYHVALVYPLDLRRN